MKQFDKLEKYCLQNNITYTQETDDKFYSYYKMLVETNKVMNLTAITELDEVEMKHFIDSLASAPYIDGCCHKWKEKDDSFTFNVIDIGSGAGFPGFPLSLVFPDLNFVLVDALNKRIGFLQNVISQLQCKNVKTIHSRAEDLGQGKYRQQFDICVSRSVADTTVLLEYCLPVVKKGGKVILYKSAEIQEELTRAEFAIKELGGILEEVRPFQLPGTDISRTLIIIDKIMDTPSKYPRKAGKPAKTPLMKTPLMKS